MKSKWKIYALRFFFCNLEDDDKALELYEALTRAENEEEMETILDFRNYTVWQPFETWGVSEVVDKVTEMASELNHLEEQE